MNHISRIASGATWEPIVGYSRAVVAGQLVEVEATAYLGDRA